MLVESIEIKNAEAEVRPHQGDLESFLSLSVWGTHTKHAYFESECVWIMD
jgi:hypothetical protein